MSLNQGVLGVYSYADSVLDAVRKLKSNGYENLMCVALVP